MKEKFNENAEVEKFTNILGIAVRLIVIDPSSDLSVRPTFLTIVFKEHIMFPVVMCNIKFPTV